MCVLYRFIEIDKFRKPAFLVEFCCARVLSDNVILD